MRSRGLLVGVLLAVLCASAGAAQFECDGNKVVCGEARFTVVTPTLVRLESAAGGAFVDEPSVLAINRETGVVAFQVCEEEEWLVVRTAALELRWLIGALPFDETNLMITWRAGGKAGTWRPGKRDEGNLLGTRGALDGIGKGNLPPLDQGLLSREGWTLLDDSERPLWLGEDGAGSPSHGGGEGGEEGWLKERADYNNCDWYFFAYGSEYGQMLKDYVGLCGRIPMLPRYSWGVWYSRYWPFTDEEEKAIVRKFRELEIPLDVLVIDVDWHKYGWEGYDWNETLFPDPEGFLKWCKEQNLAVTLNNHPGSPLPAEDTHLAAAAEMAGVTGDAAKQALGWDLADPKSNKAFVEAVHWPLEKIGVDFWWIDGAAPSRMRGLNSDVWCAKTYYDGTERRTGQRSLTFSRYGGLGQHRYPAGFSGDVFSEWDVLNYEVRYTARAGNVAFPYWSHDIGGFHGDKLDPELYVRWCQFGVFSPTMRLHSNHGVREPWNYGEEAQRIVSQYCSLRMMLYPYLNTCQREVYDTGMPLCRALYMHWPEREEAYQYDYEYMLGPDLLVAPITTPGVNGFAAKEMWIPPGLWWDYWTGEPVQGPRTMVYKAALDVCPMFVRAGAIVPHLMGDPQYTGQHPMDLMDAHVYAGADGSKTLYEDDGLSLEYQKGEFATTTLTTEEKGGDVHLTVGPMKGTFKGAVEARRWWTFVVVGVGDPERVTVDGRDLRRTTAVGGADSGDDSYEAYTYSPPDGTWGSAYACVSLKKAPTRQAVHVVLHGAAAPALIDQTLRLNPIRRCAKRAAELVKAKGVEVEALGALAEAKDAAAAQALLPDAWQAVATSGLAETDREAVLKELVGLTVSARMVAVEGSEDLEARTVVGTRFPLPGAKLTATVVANPAWPILGEPVVDLGDGGGSVRFRVQGPKALETPPLGLAEMGADIVLEYAGVRLPIRARTGVDCSFVQVWHLIGPWPNVGGTGLETVYPPEEGVDLAEAYPVEGGEAKWQETAWALPGAGDPAMFINLEPRFQPKDQQVAYAVAYLWSAAEQACILNIGSDDGCKVWLNGELVLTHPEPRAPAPGQDRVEATLKAGVNVVMYKVANEGGQWGLHCQVTDRAGKPLQNLVNLRTPADAEGLGTQ